MAGEYTDAIEKTRFQYIEEQKAMKRKEQEARIQQQEKAVRQAKAEFQRRQSLLEKERQQWYNETGETMPPSDRTGGDTYGGGAGRKIDGGRAGDAGVADEISEITSQSKPYAKSRPSYAKGQVEQVWENAKARVTGKVYDPTNIELSWDKTKPRNGQWDMGHIPGQKYADKHQQYTDDVITKEEFLKWYRSPENYRPELPSTNRGHSYE